MTRAIALSLRHAPVESFLREARRIFGKMPVMRWMFDTFPTIWILIVPVVLSFLAIVLITWIVRRLVPETREAFHAEISAPMLGAVAALLGLLLAFAIIIGYQGFLSTEASLRQEADDLASIMRDIEFFPEPGASLVGRAVADYAQSVVDDEWEAMARKGEESPVASARFDDVFTAFGAVHPKTEQQIAFYNSSVEKVNSAVGARRARIAAADAGLSMVLLGLIIFSSMVLVFYALMTGSTSFWFHVLGPATMTVVIVASIFVLMDLAYPFSGGVMLRPEDFAKGGLSGLVVKP